MEFSGVYMSNTQKKSIKSICKLLSNYMFTRKSGIIRKIWKFSKLSILKDQAQEVHEIKRRLHSLFKKLSEEELDILLRTLQSSGGIDSDCVCINPSDVGHCLRGVSDFDPRITISKAFRFPHMKDELIKILPCCCNHNSTKEDSICINPYHSSLVVDSAAPLPPYSEASPPLTPTAITSSNHTESEVSSASFSSASETYLDSFSTMSSNKSSNKENSLSDFDQNWFAPWCRITYWEERNRIGRIFDVSEDCVNVFETLPQGGGLCLSLLSNSGVPQNEASERVKEHIGYGFQLTREGNGIWLYNRSDIVLFAGSPTIQLQLENAAFSQPVVKRLLPGTSVLVYDPNLAPDISGKDIEAQTDKSGGNSLFSSFSNLNSSSAKGGPFCVRVSFEKGWGKNYTRMSVTQCPCWVEIYLNV